LNPTESVRYNQFAVLPSAICLRVRDFSISFQGFLSEISLGTLGNTPLLPNGYLCPLAYHYYTQPPDLPTNKLPSPLSSGAIVLCPRRQPRPPQLVSTAHGYFSSVRCFVVMRLRTLSYSFLASDPLFLFLIFLGFFLFGVSTHLLRDVSSLTFVPAASSSAAFHFPTLRLVCTKFSRLTNPHLV